MRRWLKYVVFLSFVGIWSGVQARAQFSNPAPGPLSATTVPQAQLMQASELAKLLKAGGPDRPVVFQVGSFVMFQQAHIPNAGFAGPGSQANGMVLLKKLGTVDAKVEGRIVIQ